MRARTARLIYSLLCLVMLVTGLGTVIFFSLPFSTAQSLANRLARDGQLESFTRTLFDGLAFLHYVGVGLILLAICSWVLRGRGFSLIDRLLRFLALEWMSFKIDSQNFFAAWKQERLNLGTWVLIGSLTLLSALNKAVLLSKPMGHDEAYTFIAFASRPLLKFIRDYHLPNNHIFHSILVHWSFQLFGDSTWAIRLPAFLAGVLLVPAAFIAGRRLFSQPAGLMAAGIVAVLPVLRDYSSSARGYTLLALFTLLVIYLGSRTLKEKNRLVWLLWVITAALGFYTIPIMLYPFAMVAAWMGISWLSGEVDPAYQGRYWVFLLACSIFAAGLTILFYLPIFIYSGISSITDNTFVQPLSWAEFSGNLLYRIFLAWKEWNNSVPLWVAYLLVAGFGIGVIFNHRLGRHKIPILLGLVVGTGVVLLKQLVAPEPRVWSFAVTVYVLTASGGLVGASLWFMDRWRWPKNWARIYLAGLLLILASVSILQVSKDFQRIREGNEGGTELSIIFLSKNLGPNDVIVTNIDEGPAIWYYARRYGISDDHIFNINNIDFTYAWILVSPGYGQDLASVLAKTNEIDTSKLDLSTAELVHQEANMDTYRVKVK